MTPGHRSISWWERRNIALLLCFAFALPLVWPTIPPLTDVPGHLARYHIALDRPAALMRAYAFQWRLIGNLGVDVAVVPLAPLLGVEGAGKLVILLIPVLGAGGMLALAKAAHGRVPPTALFALPLVLGWPFQFGFVNFCLGMALAFWLAAGWIALEARPRARIVLALAGSWVVWTCHVFAWGLLGLIVFGAELALQRRRGTPWVWVGPRAALHALAFASPVLGSLLSGTARGESQGGFAFVSKARLFESALRDHWRVFDQASVLLLVGVLVFAASHRRLRFSAVLGVPALLVFAFLMGMPGVMFGASYADTRVAPYVLALALLAIRPSADRALAGGLALAGAAFVAVRVGAATVSLLQASAAFERELAVLPAIPRGASVFALVRHGCAPDWDDRRLDHLPSMAILRRDAFTNDQWAIAGQQLLTIRPPSAAPLDRDPSQLVGGGLCEPASLVLAPAIAAFPRWRYEYVWTIGFPRAAVRDPALVPVWDSEQSALYRIDKPLVTPLERVRSERR